MTTAEHPVVTELIWLDPERLQPDPDNPRGELRHIEELAATMKDGVGVLEPITFREIPSENGQGPTLVIVRGHRRREAAILAGLGSVPCVPEGVAESDRNRAVKRMIENQARDDFSAVEEARGVQQLLDLGMDAAEIAGKLALPPERVAAASRVSASAVAVAVATKHDLTMEHALALAEFDDDKDAVVLLTKTALQDPGGFDHRLSRLRTERERATLVADGMVKWSALGYAVVDRPGYGTDSPLTPVTGLKRDLGKDSKPLTRATHKKCPGRAVALHVDWGGRLEVTEYCTDYKANGHGLLHPSRSASSSKQVSPAQAEKETRQRRIHRAAINASRAATVVRRKFVAEMVRRKTPPTGTLRFAAHELLAANHSYDFRADRTVFAVLTGGNPAKAATLIRTGETVLNEAQAWLKGATEARIPLALFASVAAGIEGSWEPNTWDRKSESRQAYLALLISAGYVPSTVEKAGILGGDKAAVLAEAEAERAAARAVGVTRSPVERAAKKAPAKKVAAPVRKVVKRAPAKRGGAKKAGS